MVADQNHRRNPLFAKLYAGKTAVRPSPADRNQKEPKSGYLKLEIDPDDEKVLPPGEKLVPDELLPGPEVILP
jgi:hypothetical protein